LRPATIEERRKYYSEEFDVSALARWIGGRRRHMKFAMIPGRHTGIVTAEHARDRDNVVIIDEWKTSKDIREYAMDYLPEGLYYDRNRYEDVSDCARCGNRRLSCRGCYNYIGQQLAFDLDPENVDCPYHGHIGDKISRGRGLSFCMIEFKKVRRQAVQLASELMEEYDEVGVVFSGRGFHVVIDDDDAYALTKRQRRELARRVGERFAIDEWVTEGGSRLMRLPYSLNAIVSRKCMIIKRGKDLLKFDLRTSELVLPEFTRSS
jgi:DNA primase catalytic subunit